MPIDMLYRVDVGVIHGFWNFFDINFDSDRLHLSKYTDQCVRIKSPIFF
jgi:hypothetical protein